MRAPTPSLADGGYGGTARWIRQRQRVGWRFFWGGELFAERDIVRAKLGVRWRFGGAVRFVARLDRLELV